MEEQKLRQDRDIETQKLRAERQKLWATVASIVLPRLGVLLTGRE